MKIGLLSDTHGWLDSKILDFFKDCDEVWHCGDIGDLAVTDRLAANFNLRAVYGNIDGGEIRTMFAPTLIFDCEGVKTVMTHIGGYPGHYDAGIRTLLKVMFDKTLGCLHINPGAAGKYGFHKVRTAIRFVIEKGKMKDLEVLELEKK